MSFGTWLILGVGAFLLYCGIKGLNPLSVLANRFGVASKSPAKLGGAR